MMVLCDKVVVVRIVRYFSCLMLFVYYYGIIIIQVIQVFQERIRKCSGGSSTFHGIMIEEFIKLIVVVLICMFGLMSRSLSARSHHLCSSSRALSLGVHRATHRSMGLAFVRDRQNHWSSKIFILLSQLHTKHTLPSTLRTILTGRVVY